MTDPEGNGEISPDDLPPAWIGEDYNVVITITPSSFG
jgi:hypothetical protein